MQDDEHLFRLGAMAICLAFMPVGLYYRARSYTGEKIDRWQEGVFILFGLRLTALAAVAAGVVWMINPEWMAWCSLPLPVWLRWVGLIAAVAGGCLWIWAVHSLGKNLSDTVITRQDHSLVTGGPYRWIRHPFYAACAIGLVGGSLVMANWFFPLAAAVFWFAFLIPRTSIEERNLAARFGDEYQDYTRRTGRFFPRLGKTTQHR